MATKGKGDIALVWLMHQVGTCVALTVDYIQSPTEANQALLEDGFERLGVRVVELINSEED